jgi:putative transposase
MHGSFRYFNSSPEIIRLTVMMYVRYPLSLRQVEDLLIERGMDICDETVRFWWNRFGRVFAAEI